MGLEIRSQPGNFVTKLFFLLDVDFLPCSLRSSSILFFYSSYPIKGPIKEASPLMTFQKS